MINLTPNIEHDPCRLYRTTNAKVNPKDIMSTVVRFSQLGYNEIQATKITNEKESYFWVFARMIPKKEAEAAS